MVCPEINRDHDHRTKAILALKFKILVKMLISGYALFPHIFSFFSPNLSFFFFFLSLRLIVAELMAASCLDLQKVVVAGQCRDVIKLREGRGK